MNSVAMSREDELRPAFEARSIRKAFGDSVVLDDLELSVQTGDTLGLLGSNGAGKTTLLKMLLGLIAPDSGEAFLAGESSGSLSPAMRERIGYVPQRPDQFSWFNGKAMLGYVGAFYPNYDKDYASELTERWKVSLRTPIEFLSPGQQQRLSIVRAMSTRPDFLVLDEPIASLDPAARISVIEELVAERSRRPLTILFSSHIVGDLKRLCSHFAVLGNGRIQLHQRAEALRTLVRVSVQGEESRLEELSHPASVHVRKTRDGERVFVMGADALPEFQALAKASTRVGPPSTDLEAVLTEWMQ